MQEENAEYIKWDTCLQAEREEAHAEGLAEGIEIGLAQSRAEGEAKGRAEGVEQGRVEGEAIGRAESLRNMAAMMKKEYLPLEQILRITGLTTEEIEKL